MILKKVQKMQSGCCLGIWSCEFSMRHNFPKALFQKKKKKYYSRLDEINCKIENSQEMPFVGLKDVHLRNNKFKNQPFMSIQKAQNI